MKYLVPFLIGLVLGAGGVFYLLRVPRGTLPGQRLQQPAQGSDTAGTAVVMLNDQFFDQVLDSIFRDLGPPSFHLSGNLVSGNALTPIAFQNGCANTVTLLPDAGGVKTRVQFSQGKIALPLAFNGTYAVMGNCMQFKGWAASTLQLSFDQSKQTVYGQVNVEGLSLEGVAPLASGLITVFVQNAINQRLNPIEVLRPAQLAPVIPVRASGGAVKTQVKDVRAEVLDGSLRLHVTYTFNGERTQTQG